MTKLTPEMRDAFVAACTLGTTSELGKIFGPLSETHPMNALAAGLAAVMTEVLEMRRTVPVMDLGPLRELRAWHDKQIRMHGNSLEAVRIHRQCLDHLNIYFPEGDRL